MNFKGLPGCINAKKGLDMVLVPIWNVKRYFPDIHFYRGQYQLRIILAVVSANYKILGLT
jgi:hypothetical protein